jgi:hypothetical protein
MNRFAFYLIAGMTGCVLAGCSSFMGNEIHIVETQKKVNPDAPKIKYLATVRIAKYEDGRNVPHTRKIGVTDQRVFGLSGNDIVLDRAVTDVVSDSLRTHLDDAGILAKDDASALFELNGVVKDLSYDVKVRDQVLIKLDSTLTEVATGKTVWAGEVVQKDERFAGVTGNSKNDIADYLKYELGIVTGKTTEAINAVLVAAHPEMFALTPGAKLIPGVKEFVVPAVAPAVQTASPVAVPASEGKPQASSGSGLLVLTTTPGHAKIYVDGVYFGLSPLRAETAIGVHTVDVKLKGYKTASEKLSIRDGESTELDLTLEH